MNSSCLESNKKSSRRDTHLRASPIDILNVDVPYAVVIAIEMQSSTRVQVSSLSRSLVRRDSHLIVGLDAGTES